MLMTSDYDVRLSPQVVKFLKKQDAHMYSRLKDGLQKLKFPLSCVEHFEGSDYKYRIGEYRALLDIDFSRKIVFVRVLDNRARIYKR